MDNKYTSLNEMQQKAVFHTEGPVLILAGAGSGKTRVLTHRIAYLIEEKNIKPWNILAITFTNKAAKEMKERVDKLVGDDADKIWVSTFHSTCVRILRMHIDKIGYEKNFIIYDTLDQKALMKECLKKLNISDKVITEKAALSMISSAKDELKSPKDYEKEAQDDFKKLKIAKVYKLYQKRLMSNNALDFDDIIVKTVELFRTRVDVLEQFQDRFKYLMVDEYQDTNTAQYQFVRLLASKRKNLCVVGDDDQSIYKFRGANIRNILDFEKDFKEAYVIKLEENYRCTKCILEAANKVIRNNVTRKDKTLWTGNEQGQLINIYNAQNENDEARFIADEIIEKTLNQGEEYRNFALLYRTNAQSRALEETLMRKNIPYRLFGGTPFYQRREIKDTLAYIRAILLPSEDLSIKRIINVPRRGIGATTVDKVEQYAAMYELDFFDVLQEADEIPQLGRSAKKLKEFANFISILKLEMGTMKLVDFVEHVLKQSGYYEYMRKEFADDLDNRLENIGEFISKVAIYEEAADEPTLEGLLEEISLVAAIDNYEEGANVVSLMTLHSAKGLEFPIVFMSGVEEGIFPSYMTIVSEDEADMQEERRLCYVGITRAQRNLYLTYAKSRMVHGRTQYARPSRFLEEIPGECIAQAANNMQPINARSFVTSSPTENSTFSKRFLDTKVQMPTPKNIVLTYGVGDVVKHKKFGAGVVKQINPAGADFEITVTFTRVGEKKLMSQFAGLQKIE